MAEPDTAEDRAKPEIVDVESRSPDAPGPSPDIDLIPDGDAPAGSGEEVSQPTKLIRIASMVRAMLEEVRRAPLDEEGREALAQIHERSLKELQAVLSPGLQDELNEVVLPFSAPVPSESELRLAQAQLVGWLEGLFHGIQATLFTQQAAAQAQLDQMHRQRMLESPPPSTPGQYL